MRADQTFDNFLIKFSQHPDPPKIDTLLDTLLKLLLEQLGVGVAIKLKFFVCEKFKGGGDLWIFS